jgi:REP element-mobilizing transposase RayT
MRHFGGRLRHETPGWVKPGSRFHLRLRAEPAQGVALSDPGLAPQLIEAARRYHELGRWWCELFLLMPDHLHAIIAFPADPGMSETIRNWKRGTARFQRVAWQENYFDHRIRNDAELGETWHYIHRNPVAKSLCVHVDDWPWSWSPDRAR